MKKLSHILFFVFCIFLAVTAEAQPTKEELAIKTTVEADQKYNDFETQINKELLSKDLPEWAGSYSFGDGLGVNVSVSIAPKSGFAFTWYGCLGLYDRNYGDVKESNGIIRFEPQLPNKREGFQGIDTEFYPIIWKDRHYLIPINRVVGFINDVNSGFAKSSGLLSRNASFLLKVGDEKKAVDGWPNIPPEYRQYLLKRPIKATLSEIKEIKEEQDSDHYNWRTTKILIDAGSKSGLKIGMELYTVAPDRVFETAKIIEVGEDSSVAEVVQGFSDPSIVDVPVLGWKLSSKKFK